MATKTRQGYRLSQRQVVRRAARAWGVPPRILWGVYGAESTWGTNGTNYFGLIFPEYDGVAVTSTQNLPQNAAVASRLLAKLHNETGSWEGALRKYSGGGYGLAHAEELGRGGSAQGAQFVSLWETLGKLPLIETLNPKNWLNPKGPPPVLEKEKERVEKGASFGVDAIEKAGEVLDVLLQGSTWVRIGEIIAGAILIYMGLKALTGIGVTDVPGVKLARSAARV